MVIAVGLLTVHELELSSGAELLDYVAVGRGIGTEIHTADDRSRLSRCKTCPNEKEYKKTDSALHG